MVLVDGWPVTGRSSQGGAGTKTRQGTIRPDAVKR